MLRTSFLLDSIVVCNVIRFIVNQLVIFDLMIIKNHTYFLWLYNKRKYWHFYHLWSGLFIWFFLVITQPFGMYNNNLSLGGLLLFVLIFAIIWPLISYLVDGVTRLLDYGKEVTKNLFLWLVKIVIMTHVIYVIREYFCPGICIDLKEYGEIWMASFLIFLFTYVPYSLFGRYMYYHSLVGIPHEDLGLFILKGHGKDQLTFSLNDLIYLQADDNYVDVFLRNQFQEEQYMRKQVLRSTLSMLETQLMDYPEFVRIHRSIIVNAKYVLQPHKKGTLTVVNQDQKIQLPVSRSYQSKVDQVFTHPK